MSVDKILDEIEAFKRMRSDLEKHHMGKHVIIKDGRHVGTFDTFDTAARHALQHFGSGPFLIRQVGAPECVPIPASVAWQPVHAAR